MINPLTQKFQYYLNESHRLNEELKSEEAYSEILENVLFELLGEEDFTKLFEYVMKGTLTHDEKGNPLSPERAARRAHRIAQIANIGVINPERESRDRVIAALLAKGVSVPGQKYGEEDGDAIDAELYRRSRSATATPMEILPNRVPHWKRTEADKGQKWLSLQRRTELKKRQENARNVS